ncbi:MAG: PepSY-associated TM helix domain-containing protein [Shewanella sp.]
MTKILKLLHNWFGFLISLIMLIVLTTGIYLGSVDLLKRFDSKGQVYSDLSYEHKAEIAGHILEKYPQAAGVKLPTVMFPYVEAYSRQKSTYLTTELKEIGTLIKSDNEVWRFMFFFHRNFQMGDVGKHINAISTILAAVIMVIGLYLWWLIRKAFKWKHTLPKNSKNSALIKSHIQLGLIFSIPLLIMAMSGAYITYGTRGSSSLDENRQKPILAGANDWQAQILAAQKLWPKSELVSVSKPRKPGDVGYIYSLNFNGDNVLGLMQADTIKVDLHSGQLVSAKTFADKELAQQVRYSARFLHDGARMPTWYLLVLILSSVVGTLMVSFALVTFVRNEFLSKRRINMGTS